MTQRQRSRRRFSLIVAICCLTGGTSTRPGAWFAAADAAPAEAAPRDVAPREVAPREVAPREAALAGAGPAWTDQADGPLSSCEQAGIVAEQASGLPTGILLAIGRVESGRWDPVRGRMTSWPWTINAAGRGLWFDSKQAAAETVRTLLDSGTRSIDVGCFQINLQYHPLAFSSLEQGFDPEANARYAARFLLSLFSRTGSWEAAVESYHSADPVLGFAYRQQVFSAWGPVAAVAGVAARGGTSIMLAPRQKPRPIPLVIAGVQIWTPMPAGTGATVVAMPGSPAPDPSPRSAAAAMPPLPVVSYHVMPRR